MIPTRQLLALAAVGEVGQDRVLHVPILPAAPKLPRSAAEQVLTIDELVWSIGQSLLATHTSILSVYPLGTRKQLLAFALTCKAWLDTGLALLWRNIDNLKVLVDVLVPDHLRPSYAEADHDDVFR